MISSPFLLICCFCFFFIPLCVPLPSANYHRNHSTYLCWQRELVSPSTCCSSPILLLRLHIQARFVEFLSRQLLFEEGWLPSTAWCRCHMFLQVTFFISHPFCLYFRQSFVREQHPVASRTHLWEHVCTLRTCLTCFFLIRAGRRKARGEWKRQPGIPKKLWKKASQTYRYCFLGNRRAHAVVRTY